MATTNIIEIRNSLMSGGAPSQDMGTGGGGSSATKGKDNRSMWKKYVSDSRINKVQKGFFKKLGVSFGIAQVLKQSQIFTSLFGTLFQIIGAIVDVMLAPLTKYLAPLLSKFATWSIENAQKVAAKFETFLDWMANDEGFFMTFVKDSWTVVKLLWDLIFNPAKIIDRIIPGLGAQKKFDEMANKAGKKIWGVIKTDIDIQWETIKTLSSTIGTWSTDLGTWTTDTLPKKLESIHKKVTEKFTDMTTWMTDTLPKKIDSVYKQVKGLYDGLVELWNPLIAWIKKISGWVDDKVDAVKGAVTNGANAVVKWGSNLLNGTEDGIGVIIDSNEKLNETVKNSWQVDKKIADKKPKTVVIKEPPNWAQYTQGWGMEKAFQQKSAELENMKKNPKPVVITQPPPNRTSINTLINKWKNADTDEVGEAILKALEKTSENMYKNQMDMTDQQLREHTKTDFDSMLAYKQNSNRGFEGNMGSW